MIKIWKSEAFVNFNSFRHKSYHALTFVIYTNIQENVPVVFIAFLKNRSNSNYHVLMFYHIFSSKSLSKLNLVFIYLLSKLSELFSIDLLTFLILFYSSSYYFSVSLLSSVETNVKYLFALLSLFYPFLLSIATYKGITVLNFP